MSNDIPALDRFEQALECPGLADWAEIAAFLADELRRKRQRPQRALSVTAFIIARGGVSDSGGELRAMGAHRLRPGLVNNRTGLTLDRVRGLLVEFGYMIESGEHEPAITTGSDVLELIRDELSGRRHYPGEAPF